MYYRYLRRASQSFFIVVLQIPKTNMCSGQRVNFFNLIVIPLGLGGVFLIKIIHQRTGTACFHRTGGPKVGAEQRQTSTSRRAQLTLSNSPSSCLSASESQVRGSQRGRRVPEPQEEKLLVLDLSTSPRRFVAMCYR